MTENLVEFWYMALSSPYGVELICSDFESVRNKLYQVRRDLQDPDLDQLSLVRSPLDPDKIWIMKRNPDAPA